jgi:Rrf2 family protein
MLIIRNNNVDKQAPPCYTVILNRKTAGHDLPDNNNRKDVFMILRRDRAMTAVLIMLDVAFYAGRAGTVSAADIAERSGLVRRGIEPLLQALSRSGLLESIRGPRGGYKLGRPRRDISLVNIIKAVAGEDQADESAVASPMLQRVIEPCWAEYEEILTEKMQQTTLDDLVRRAEKSGLKRPLNEPITFSI